MARKLAYRNLFHDQLSLFVTLVGIVFSVVLVAVQCSIYLGSEFRIVSVMDHIKADLWVLPGGTKSFDLPVLLPGRSGFFVEQLMRPPRRRWSLGLSWPAQRRAVGLSV